MKYTLEELEVINRRLNKEWAIESDKVQMLEKECAALRDQIRQLEQQIYGGGQ